MLYRIVWITISFYPRFVNDISWFYILPRFDELAVVDDEDDDGDVVDEDDSSLEAEACCCSLRDVNAEGGGGGGGGRGVGDDGAVSTVPTTETEAGFCVNWDWSDDDTKNVNDVLVRLWVPPPWEDDDVVEVDGCWIWLLQLLLLLASAAIVDPVVMTIRPLEWCWIVDGWINEMFDKGDVDGDEQMLWWCVWWWGLLIEDDDNDGVVEGLMVALFDEVDVDDDEPYVACRIDDNDSDGCDEDVVVNMLAAVGSIEMVVVSLLIIIVVVTWWPEDGGGGGGCMVDDEADEVHRLLAARLFKLIESRLWLLLLLLWWLLLLTLLILLAWWWCWWRCLAHQIRTVVSSEALANKWGYRGFQWTQFTVRVWPFSTEIGCSRFICQM